MAAIKSFTSIEQSRKLAQILPLESADMYYHYNTSVVKNYHEDIPKVIQLNNHFVFFHADIPCWSIAALLSVLPDELEDNYFLSLQKERDEYCCCYEDINGDSFTHIFADNPVDACYEMIIHLNELKML